ncbi:protein ARK2N isoform X2 [Hyperolius riggenbachi]|uniref:protein ARK2N isoform X2 n=1 Tax=Hyperolius riggenbachi TaxID=752182 RepID=UPI0035A34833
MKMEAVGKSEQLLDSEVPPVTQLKVDSPTDEGALDLQSPSLKDGTQDVPDSSGLSSMPCLLKELRRDSSESQLASTESDKPSTGRVYESDSSNHCMLSPSSSGHLADSDTLSSAEENQTRRPEAISEGCEAAAQGSAVARKSRRSRSESETSTMAAKKNRQSSDKQNGRVTKVKGHRSQKHKERIRLLRQKREAAARKKYNLLQDSSTSDSDLTCDSSTSSSDDDEEVSGSSKTITAEIPDGPAVVTHYDISDTNSDQEVLNVDSMLAATVVKEYNSVSKQESMPTWRTRGLLEELHADSGLETKLTPFVQPSKSPKKDEDEINIASSGSEVEIVGVQEQARYVHPRGGVIQRVSSWKHSASPQNHSSHQTPSWTSATPQQNWTAPQEVVDLTLEEESMRRYLL